MNTNKSSKILCDNPHRKEVCTLPKRTWKGLGPMEDSHKNQELSSKEAVFLVLQNYQDSAGSRWSSAVGDGIGYEFRVFGYFPKTIGIRGC